MTMNIINKDDKNSTHYYYDSMKENVATTTTQNSNNNAGIDTSNVIARNIFNQVDGKRKLPDPFWT